ncbi:hypothetical protein Slin14017_G052740 [Septoria linicola]|nr:hypothetical protein Slin14017_G052740 [Septoria linicola]
MGGAELENLHVAEDESGGSMADVLVHKSLGA